MPSIRTTSIIDPPVRNGGMASSSSARPNRTPIPSGPSILCPEKTRKSTPSAVTSTGWCGTDCAAVGQHQRALPRAPARAISATGGIVPVTFDWWVTATILVRLGDHAVQVVQVEPPVGR